MTISISDSVQATRVFIIIFFIAVLISARRKKFSSFFPLSLTQELKGLAILAVIFSHLGYFLISDHRFLFPLSILAGVGVNLFLFLSGYGLTNSALKNQLTVWQFYRKRLLKLFVPLWLVLATYLVLDFFVLKITYSWQFIGKAFLGIFTSADLFHDLNSPLWYFTLILFYYLVFPLVFFKKRPWLSATFIYLVTYIILRQNPVWLNSIITLYQVHLLAFPLGILAGWLFYEQTFTDIKFIRRRIWLSNLVDKFKRANLLTKLKNKIHQSIYWLIIILSLIFIAYFSYYSGVGQGINKEQMISVITMLAIIFLFSYKKIEFRLFSLFGLYSYEIYLLHWPLVYRYDFLFKNFPAWLATTLYLILFLALGWLLNKLSSIILDKIKK